MSLLGEIRYIDEQGNRYLYAPGDHVLVRRDLVVDDDGEIDYESCDGKIHCDWYSEKECLAKELKVSIECIDDMIQGYRERGCPAFV